MSEYTCTSCGESFPTLTKKRLHQSDCPEADLVADGGDMDPDELVEWAVEETLVCDVCGEKNEAAESISTDETDAGVAYELRFECTHCGARNENTAILGRSR